MKKHKNKIIAGVLILAALTAAFIFGGNYNKPGGADTAPEAAAQSPNAPPPESQSAAPSVTADAEDAFAPVSQMPEAPSQAPATETPEASPAPEGSPPSAEPRETARDDGSFTVTLTVRCDMILNNMNLLDKEKHELVPADGVILAVVTATAYEGESVFNVLQRELRRAGIHMEFVSTPIYNSAYIEDIGNIREFDAGELSGWVYKVNGTYPNYGSSRYLLTSGDAIEWHYTCDLGRDLGDYNLGKNGQKDD